MTSISSCIPTVNIDSWSNDIMRLTGRRKIDELLLDARIHLSRSRLKVDRYESRCRCVNTENLAQIWRGGRIPRVRHVMPWEGQPRQRASSSFLIISPLLAPPIGLQCRVNTAEKSTNPSFCSQQFTFLRMVLTLDSLNETLSLCARFSEIDSYNIDYVKMQRDLRRS